MTTPAGQQAPAAPNNWHPSPDGLRQMVSIFADPDPSLGMDQHKVLYQQLSEMSLHPEFVFYLSYILLHLTQHEADVRGWMPHYSAGEVSSQLQTIRSRAGLQLKNKIKDGWTTLPLATREYVKGSVLTVLSDPSPFLRNIVGTIVTTICKKQGLEGWPGILQLLVSMLDSNNHCAMDGAFNALAKICEDMPHELDSERLQRPLNFLLPKFITFFLHPHKDIRKYALATVNVFLLTRPAALFVNLDAYMSNLFVLAGQDATKEIRQRVCQAFVLLLEVKFEAIQGHIEQVVQFMLAASADEDEQVCLEACEFWSAYCECQQLDTALLSKYLDHLVPILLNAMKYSPEELGLLGDENEEDQWVPDRAEDIKPRFHRSAAGGAGGGARYSASRQLADAAADQANGEEEDDDEDLEDDDDWQDDEEPSNWTLRKCAAAALDTLANVYKSALLPYLLPKLQAALNAKSENEEEDRQVWLVRESGVLALGAIAEGCFEGLREYLSSLIPFLMTHFLHDKKPLVRSITCWTLSRYCKWIVSESIPPEGATPEATQQAHTRYLQPLIQGLLERILDKNKKVQEAACSSFATLEEEACTMLVPYLKDILNTLMFAFGKYQAKNVLILYDCIGTLSEAVHEHLNQPHLVQILMPPLMHKWNTLSDDDRNIFPLLECLTAVAQALGKGFFIFAEPVFGRCCQIIEKTLLAQKEAERLEAEGVDTDFPDKEFIVCALDLLSGLAEGLEDNIEGLVSQLDQKVLGLLFQCLQDLDADVRQSAFALLGDLAKTCMGHLRPHLHEFIPLAARNLNPHFYSVCNNASWAIGELAVKAGPESMRPFVADILAYLRPILLEGTPSSMRSLLENAAITIGRLAFVCPDQVAPYLEVLCKKWLEYLAPLKENSEKEHAFKGLSLAIQHNPTAILRAHAFPDLCAAIASWSEPSQEMATIFHQLLHSYKNSLGQPAWTQTMQQCDQRVQHIIAQKYQL